MKVCLTGATGFIGRYVLERLLARDDEVVVLALPETIEQLPHRDGVQVVAASLEDPDALAEATREAEVVYHLAALLPGSDPRDLFRVNVDGTENLLRATPEGVRFVFTSSVAVYRPAPWPFMWPITEDHPQAAYANEGLRSYGQSKIDAEQRILRAHDERGLEYVILRPTATYGPGAQYAERLLQHATRPWGGWAPGAGWGMPPWLQPGDLAEYGAEYGVLQSVHVRDLADAVVRAGTVSEAANEVINVAGGEVFTPQQVAAAVWQTLAPASTPYLPPYGGDSAGPHGQGPPGFHLGGLAGPHRPGLASAYLQGIAGSHRQRLAGRYRRKFDISKAERVLGYTPQVSLREGLEEMVSEARERWWGPSGWMAWWPWTPRGAASWSGDPTETSGA